MNIVEFAIRRRVTILMLTVALLLFGVVSLLRLKVDLLPDLSYPTLTVRTELPGSAPLEVENLITRPVEEAVGIIRNVRHVRSVSRSGQSDVTLEFAWGTDMDLAGIDVREKLDLLLLPLEAKRPLLLRFDPAERARDAAGVHRQDATRRPLMPRRRGCAICAASPKTASSRSWNRSRAPLPSRSAAATRTRSRSTSISRSSRSSACRSTPSRAASAPRT